MGGLSVAHCTQGSPPFVQACGSDVLVVNSFCWESLAITSVYWAGLVLIVGRRCSSCRWTLRKLALKVRLATARREVFEDPADNVPAVETPRRSRVLTPTGIRRRREARRSSLETRVEIFVWLSVHQSQGIASGDPWPLRRRQ
eukprot:6475944-Amphidinium_carterae.1